MPFGYIVLLVICFSGVGMIFKCDTASWDTGYKCLFHAVMFSTEITLIVYFIKRICAGSS